MGITACILFGIIGAWITRSLMADTVLGSIKLVFIIGVIGGLLGLTGIFVGGWGDLESFNLYNVLLSIIITSVIMFVYSKLQPRQKLAKNVAD